MATETIDDKMTEHKKAIDARRGYIEGLKEIEKREENIDLQQRGARVQEFRRSEVWEKDIEPKLIGMLITLETNFCSTKDFYERGALVEAYSKIKEFKLWIDEISEIR